jgi:hypothetical protein
MEKKKFTVGYQMAQDYSKRGSNPCVRFGGQWLKNYGFDVGDKLELIQGKNMLIFIKVPSDT